MNFVFFDALFILYCNLKRSRGKTSGIVLERAEKFERENTHERNVPEAANRFNDELFGLLRCKK